MKDILYGHSEHIKDLCNFFSIDANETYGFEFECHVGALARLTVNRYVERPEKIKKSAYGVFPLSWEGCCIGCRYYGFGGLCRLMDGQIPISSYMFYCQAFMPSSRNLIIYRPFMAEYRSGGLI